MEGWQATTGTNGVGGYLRVGANELYVKQDGGGWGWYLDGVKMGMAREERTARSDAEAAVRAMQRTHTAAMAAPAN